MNKQKCGDRCGDKNHIELDDMRRRPTSRAFRKARHWLVEKSKNGFKSMEPIVPYILLVTFPTAAYVILWHLVPFCVTGDSNVWTSMTYAVEAPMVLVASFCIIAYVKALLEDPGEVPLEWVDWDGNPSTQPPVPDYAKISENWKAMYRKHKESGGMTAVEQMLQSAESFKKPRTINYADENNEENDQVPGVRVVLSSTIDETEWRQVNVDHSHDEDNEDVGEARETHVIDMEDDDEKAETLGQKFKMNPEILEALKASIQWPGEKPVDANVEDLVFGNAMQLNAMSGGDLSAQLEVDVKTLFCSKGDCSNFRPPRAHHCRRCKRCILRHDHHCVWLNKCVGLGNHRSFYLFLVYLFVGDVLFQAMSAFAFLYGFGIFGAEGYGLVSFLHLGFVVFGLASLSFQWELLKAQTKNLLQNNTELEKIFNPADTLIKYAKGSLTENLSVVLGENKWLWFLP